MTDPRELLDRLAGSTVYLGENGEYSQDALTPVVFAALRAVLNLHVPRDINAAAKNPDGTCPFCHLGEPIRTDTSINFVSGDTHPVHVHLDEAVRHPCPTLLDLAEGYGLTEPEGT
jgi:hypothetical protein